MRITAEYLDTVKEAFTVFGIKISSYTHKLIKDNPLIAQCPTCNDGIGLSGLACIFCKGKGVIAIKAEVIEYRIVGSIMLDFRDKGSIRYIIAQNKKSTSSGLNEDNFDNTYNRNTRVREFLTASTIGRNEILNTFCSMDAALTFLRERISVVDYTYIFDSQPNETLGADELAEIKIKIPFYKFNDNSKSY